MVLNLVRQPVLLNSNDISTENRDEMDVVSKFVVGEIFL